MTLVSSPIFLGVLPPASASLHELREPLSFLPAKFRLSWIPSHACVWSERQLLSSLESKDDCETPKSRLLLFCLTLFRCLAAGVLGDLGRIYSLT